MTSFNPSTPLFAGNSTFVEELYERYLQNPANVDASWRDFFRDMGGNKAQAAASWAQVKSKVIGAQGSGDGDQGADKKKPTPDPRSLTPNGEAAIHDSIRAIMMVRAYRVRGHLMANLDPLGLEDRSYHPELDPAHYGFSDNAVG